MASVVINTRFNNRKAEADLKELQARAKETAREINAVEKGFGSAMTKRNKLRDNLEAARQKAAETAAALDEVNARLDAGRKSKFGVTNTADEALSNKLAAQLNAQDAKAREIEADYRAQNSTVQTLQQRHTDLTAQLEREQQAAQAQGNRVANADRIRAAAEAAGALAEKLTRAVLTGGTLQKALHTVGTVGQKAFAWVGGKAQAVRDRIAQAAQSAAQFRSRVARLVSGALVFNVLSSGLRTLTSWMGTALLSSSQLRAALGNLQGAASTAAAPLLAVLVPALTALANAAAMVFSYIARLVAFFTGKTISASASAAKAMGGVGKAAGGTAKKVKDANGELAAFDELNVLNKKSDEDNGGSSGGGGSVGDIVPDYDFTAKSPFLDSILDAVEAGDWYKVGQLIGEKLRDSLNAIPWPDIQDKAVQWATNLATMLNGIVETPGLWEAIGHTLAQGLNTALLFYDTFMQTFHWASLGAGLAAGLTQAIAEIQWDTLGRALTDGMRAAIMTLYNFTMTFTGWTDLGNGIAACLNAAINNIPWQEAAVGIMTHCVQKDAAGKPYFGWSIDLNGSHDVYDEPPGSLQLLPLFDFCSPTDEIYRNTVAMIRSPEYKYSFANSPINEIGCPHAPHPWILSLANSLLCGRVEHCRAILEKISMDNGIACESVDEVTGYCTTGEAFATCAGFLCHSIREALL